jgi:hypothetical protein
VQTQLLHCWSREVEQLRTWAQGCRCHEAGPKGSGQACPLKGLRAREAFDKVEATCLRWEGLRAQASSATFLPPDYRPLLANMFTATLGELRLRFAWLAEGEWAVLRWDAVLARAVRARTRSRAEAGQAAHRVLKHFFLPNGAFQQRMDKWIDDGDLDPELEAEFEAYRWGPLDEAIVESPHASISNTHLRAPHSSVSWWASSLRLQQNLCEYERSTDDPSGGGVAVVARQQWHASLQGWKAIVQPDASKARRLVGVARMRASVMLSIFYRRDQWNTTDWALFRDLMPGRPMPERYKLDRLWTHDMQQDFYLQVLRTGVVHSVMGEDS